MLNLTAADVAAALPYNELVDALAQAFAGEAAMPRRTHHDMHAPGQRDATLLLMPAWQPGAALGVKIATVFPDNGQRNLPAVYATYLLLDPSSGAPLAVIEGTELTARRTAAASALASRYLSRGDARTLLMIGTGKLAPHLVAAHASVRDLRRVLVWGRRPEAARAVAERVHLDGVEIDTVTELRTAIQSADIVSCATLSTEPLIEGRWLCEGQHIDLVGAYAPHMREADGAALGRAEVYVDTIAGATVEGGDIVQAIAEGALRADDIRGELRDLAAHSKPGRETAREITLFKSVGCALEDLAAACLVYSKNRRHETT